MKKLYNINFQCFVVFCLVSSFFSANAQIMKMPQIDVSVPQNGCAPTVVSFFNKSHTFYDTTKIRYRWYVNADFNPFFTGYTPPAKTFNAGNFNIRVEADSAGIFKGSANRSFNLAGKPTKFLPDNNAQYCPGEDVTFRIQDNVMNLTWDYGDGPIFDGSNKNNWTHHVYKTAGTYNVKVFYNHQCGSDTLKQSVIVTPSAKPTVYASIWGDWNICINDEATFGTDDKYMAYTWNFGDGSMSNESNPKHSYSVMKSYPVIVTAKNSCGNTGVDTVFVNVTNNMQAWAQFNFWFQGSTCPNTPVNFHANGSGKYQWSFGDGGNSNLREPMNMYADTGKYKVRLVLTNGCGRTDTAYNYVHVMMDNSKQPPFPNIALYNASDNNNNNGNQSPNDTLKLCPGEKVIFKNTNWDDGSKYKWELGDGFIFTGQSGEHAYNNPGVYTVKLTLTNNCKASVFATKVVKIDGKIKPLVNLKAVPKELCPGEKVFYFDDGNSSDNPRYSYSIDFGDGTSLNNIKTPQDTLFKTLATHAYPNVGTFNFKFRAFNSCGNKDSIFGPILVNTTPKVPFYYVDNSTTLQTNGMSDWSIRKMPFDSKFLIPVRWDTWPGIDTTLTVFFWWGQFDPSMPDKAGDPAGFVTAKIKNIKTDGIDTIVAYIPFDLTKADSVGMAVAWYCNHQMRDGMPDAFVTAIKSALPVKSIKVIPSGIVDIGVKYAPGIVFPPNAFGGTCKPNLQGTWNFMIAANDYYLLDAHNGQYNLVQAPQPNFYASNNMISKGNYNVKGDTVTFFDSSCGSSGTYKFAVAGNRLMMYMLNEDCPSRMGALKQKQYVLLQDNKQENDRIGCPGDKVKFMLAGGTGVQWDFGDGSAKVTGPVVYHVYPNVGNYVAKAIATNSCNRTDTMRTLVRIGNTKLPDANFDMDKYWAAKGDTINFKYWGNGGGGSDVDNNKYKWEFGDGLTSSIRYASHSYQLVGGYDVKLTITNGCGTNSAMRHVEIGSKFDNCTMLAKYIIQKADTAKLYPNVPIKFMNASSGVATKYSWNFSDGSLDTAANPSHTFTKAGYYKVCLSVYNDVTKCSDQICMDLLVGQQSCKADYMFVVNNTTNTLQLTDKSYKATKWNWDYKDGKFDTIPNPIHQYAKPGIYEVCLATYDKLSNCQSRMCQIIPIGKIDSTKYCKAEYSYFVDNAGLQVNFKNESVGKILKGYWNLGDGFYAYEENPVHKYAKAGLYHVCGSIVDSAGCQSEICKDIQVGSLSCNADFNFFVDPANQQVSFTNIDLGKNLKYFWDFGDGKSSALANPVNKYLAKGVYKVAHTIIDSISKCRSDKMLEISIGEVLCSADFTYMIEPVTRKVKFALVSDSMVRKQWNFGDGGIDTLVRPAHQYVNDGVYQVCLNIYNPKNKCVANRCLSIPVSSQTSVAMLDADFAYMVDPNTLKTSFNDKSTGKVRRYYWDFGDGMSDTTANPIHMYLKSGQYKVCEFVADSAKNVSQECKDVFVKNALCKADFNFFVTPGTLSAQLTDMSSPGIKEHYWDLGDGKFSNKKDFLNAYTAAGTYKVCKSIVDSANCKASVCKDLQIGTLSCKANYSFFVDAATLNVKYTDLSVGGATSYFWDFGDGGFSNLKDPSHVYLKPGIYKVCQTIKNIQTGCTSNICQDVQVGSINCEAYFTYTVDALSRTVTLQNASKGDIKRFYWENGAGKMDTIENTKFVYTADGNYNVCLQVFNPLTNCRANICKNITIIKDTAKLVRFAADYAYFVVIDSNKVVLSDKSTGDPSQWYWTFGDGNYEKAKNTSHIFKYAGSYKLCHSIFKSSTGEFDENCKDITIGSMPCSLSAGFTKFIDAKTQTVYFSDNSQGRTQKWFWRFGDGATSQKQNPSHTFINPGYYLVGLGVRDTIKNCTDYYAEMVQVGTVTCKALFDYTVDMTANKLTLKNASSGNVAKYFWEFGDRGTSVEPNPVYTYADAGSYRVNLVAASADASCKDVYSQSIQIGTINCSAAFEYYVDSISNRVFFKNKGLGTTTKCMWFFGDGYNSSLQNPDHKYVAPGYYKVGLNTYNPANGCMDYYEEVVLVGSEGIDCEADFIYQIDEATKTGKFFDKSSGKGLKYRWNYGDKSSMDTVANTSHAFSKGGYYNVCLTILAPNGIQNTSCKPVKVAPPLVNDCFVDFVFNVDSISRTVSFTDKSTVGVDNWSWDFGDNLTDVVKNPSHVYTKSGYFKVTLAGKNQTTGCAKAAAKLVNVAEVYALRTSFGYGLDSTKLKASGGFPVNFVGLSTGDAAKYVWDFGDGTKDSSTVSPTHTYAAAGTYNVCLTASDQVTKQSNAYCYQIKIGPTAVGALVSPDEYELKAYPSPFNTFVNIEYSIVAPGDYEIVLRDVSGRVVDVIAKGAKSSGDYKEMWEGKSISSGVYYLQLLNKGNVVKTITIIKAK